MRALLPETGTDIKGNKRSTDELRAACRYDNRQRDFDDLIRILDGELRLITPVDISGVVGDEWRVTGKPATHHPSPATLFPPATQYQLTHDYLVPSLRDWLTRKQRETRKGRAELKLAERATTWSDKRENKQLPTLSEWFSIRTLTDSKKWTVPERTIMQRAGRAHGSWWGGLVLATFLIGFGIQQWISSERWKNLQEQTQTSVEALQNNLGPSVPFNLEKLKTLPAGLVLPELQSRFASTTNPRHKLSLAFALAHYGKLDDDDLISRIDDIAESDRQNYWTALKTNVPIAVGSIQAESAKCSDKSLWRRKAKLAIVALNLGDTALASDMCVIEDRPDPEQRTLFIDEFPRWENQLKDIHDLVTSSDSPAFRSGMCLAVGQIAADKLIDTDKERWQSLASRWFVEKGDTTTHSAAGWLLRRWGIAEPKAPDRDKIVPQRDWFVNSVGATMLKIRPNSPVAVELVGPLETYPKQLAAISQVAAAAFDKNPKQFADRAFAILGDFIRGGYKNKKQLRDYPEFAFLLNDNGRVQEFWVADREVSRVQFELFMNDASYPAKEKPQKWGSVDMRISPTADHPAQQITWYESVMYCNWLSQHDGRKPCYERTGTKEKSSGNVEYDAWRFIQGSNGYRLLREVEWEYACRAGTQTEYSMGNDETLLVSYCQMYPSKLTALWREDSKRLGAARYAR